MALNTIENLKNKYNTLLSQNLKNNSFIEMSRGSSSKQGTIQDLIFDNTLNIKNNLEQDLKNNTNKNIEKEDNIIENFLALLINPANINNSLKSLNSISKHTGLEGHLDDVMQGISKANKAINKVLKGLF